VYELTAGIDAVDFQAATGKDWVVFTPANPAAAGYLEKILALVGVGYASFGLLAGVIAAIPYRSGERWSWYAMWIFPIGLALTTAIFLITASELVYFYGVVTLVAIIGMLLPLRKFFPK